MLIVQRILPSAPQWSRTLGGPIAAVAVALWTTRRAWGDRPPAGDDVMALLVWEDFSQSLVDAGRLDGWFPGFILGYQKFLFYGPGFSWIVGLVRLAGLGAISTEGAVKVVAIASFAAVGPAAAFLARSLGLSIRTSAVAAVLVLCIDSPFGLGLSGVFGVALLAQQVAASLFCLTLGAAVRALRTPASRWRVVAACGLGALLLTHPVTLALLAIVGGLVVVGISVSDRPTLRAWTALAGSAAAAIGTCGFWVIPYFAHRELRGPSTGFAVPSITERVESIMSGDLILQRWTAPLLITGLAFAVATAWRGDRRLLAVAAVPPMFLVGTHVAADHALNDLTLLLPVRGLGLVALIGLLPVAALISSLASPLGRWATAAAVAIAIVITVGLGPPSGLARQQPIPAIELRQAARVLSSAVPDGARFATERDFPGEIDRLGVSHPDFWLARSSNRATLNTFGIESSSSPGAGGEADRIGKAPANEVAANLARLGVTHVATVKAATADDLVRSSRYELLWRGDDVAVFALLPFPDSPDPGSLINAPQVEASMVRANAERVAIDVRVSRRTTASIAIAWSPKWHLRVDGRPRSLGSTLDGLLSTELRPEDRRIELTFEPDRWDRIGIAASLAAIASAVGYFWGWSSLMSRRRSRTA